MPNDIRDRNRARILQVLMANSPLSRMQISQQTNLSKSTVSVIVSDLLREELVCEGETGASGASGGRRPVLLRFNDRARFACGIEIDAETCHGVLVDLQCKPLRRASLGVRGSEVSDVLTSIASTVDRLLEGDDRTSCVGCGVAMVGLVNSDEGIVLSSTHFAWRDVPLRDLLAEHLGFPVRVADRPKAAVLGEKWYGIGQGVDNLVYIHLGSGIGAGIVIGGELYAGQSHTAGEIGHITVDRDGPLCGCGNRGCLEALASGPAIARRTIALAKGGSQTSMADWVEGNLELITAKMVDQAASKGDQLALRVIRETGEHVGIAIANLLDVVNPELVIVGGPVARFGKPFLDSIHRTVRQRALSLPASAAQIVLSVLGQDAEAIGAAALVLQECTRPLQLAQL